MSIRKTAASILTSGALMAAVIPMANARTYTGPTADASKARCETLAGREESRCLTVHRRNSRMRLQNLDKHMVSGRGNTRREQRVITKNISQDNVRSRGSVELKNMRSHDLNGGNSRRDITERASAARAACKDLDSTAKFTCIREHMKTLNK